MTAPARPDPAGFAGHPLCPTLARDPEFAAPGAFRAAVESRRALAVLFHMDAAAAGLRRAEVLSAEPRRAARRAALARLDHALKLSERRP